MLLYTYTRSLDFVSLREAIGGRYFSAWRPKDTQYHYEFTNIKNPVISTNIYEYGQLLALDESLTVLLAVSWFVTAILYCWAK